MWFEGDDRATEYKGHLEEWDKHFVNAATEDKMFKKANAEAEVRHWKASAADDERFKKLETLAGLRAKPKPLAEKTVVAEKKKSARKVVAKEVVDAPTEVATWDSDPEDDEHEDAPLVDSDDEADDFVSDETLEQSMAKLKWEDVGRTLTDQRAATGSMPESIIPGLHLVNFREESWLNWFLHWVPLKTIAEIVEATNEAAKDVKWSSYKSSLPWKKLTTGEFMRWLGVWVLMTVYPVAGKRRTCWRGVLKFGQFMPEKRFENILRAFTLPMYKCTDEEWGGPGREECEEKKFDPFFATRKFSDQMRSRFQNAMKPGGWLCTGGSMFSWLGRALKLPGWKAIKRKPHPIGLESKATACSVTGMLIDFEHQEGKKIMGHFECVGECNESTSWLLRLTSRWHNEEKRTVIADAAFAQVRAAVGLHVEGGLFLIGNVKGARKFFPQAALREECPACERNKLVCLTKKATMKISKTEKLDVFATGWRCTGNMVVTCVHTGGCNTVGSDRKKRKCTQMNNGKVNEVIYHVKRPKVSAEYQGQMGAIDGHNYRRQSGKGTGSLEKVCVTNDTKDRIFINMIGWVLINVYLAKKHFEWGGIAKKTSSEVQEAIALALINNQWLEEGSNGTQMMNDDDDGGEDNDPGHCQKHPRNHSNLCKKCHKHKTYYICTKCSDPQPTKSRKDKGRIHGQPKLTMAGYMHFCKNGCFAEHACGFTKLRRPKGYRHTAF